MRRLVPFVLLLAPLPASAQGGRGFEAFCNGLRQVVVAAGSGFDSLPLGQRQIPGSIEERRGITQTGDGPPRGTFFATMMRDQSRQRPNPVVARFNALQAEITRCLPEAQANPAAAGQDGARASWTLPMAVVGLRRDDGEGDASTAEVEISIASRW